ncbi:methyltransferase [Nocardiopsis kunsanensis]|uniref:Methyltransferase n=1 Tax=Nocardiopsis kunsanensis TaxID=141693 RepID=A0A918XBR0_9ACTN|nr:methyltransferase [Nocardiopsis kunsanensis]GHD24628.1 methyltransferase [Nocardiopsis kunsanensis]
MDPGDADDAYALLAKGELIVHARALQTAAELGLGDLLAGGPRTVGALAEAAGCEPDALRRLLGLLAGDGVVARVGDDRFELTRAGGPLSSDHPASVRSVLAMDGAVAPLVIGATGHTVATGEPAFPQALGSDFYDHLDAHPEQGEVFDRAMDDLTRVVVPGLLSVCGLSGTERVVDVGGGNGTLLAEILRAHPRAEGVLLETPRVADTARIRFRDQGTAERCRIVPGDFFEHVPEGGDVYLLKWVLHNWPDEDALRILRSCRRAMGPGARLLVVESVLPDGDGPHPSRAMDLAMLVLSGGRERTRSDYAALFDRAGLRLESVRDADARYGVVEAVPGETVPGPEKPSRT